ncbi:MAG: glycosyltransferase [Luteibacter sp.]|uniref:glycosyltransferase n=1 Tax=unclassified Luteibacter TaxID=2620188 RepID=UPI002806AEB5|nr:MULTISPECIES: glycosyltransferase [unclassified Luteibacter]MDQ7994680.1 glycosyltransferase [Luteibacter sp.]MDQ8048253.1 glycosyltransferase [Luteibacter sp.]MDR6641831.1 UDP:flavonoid glycosyltransferase YjiC (YdhE family) [Luteibacter sp. 1214]
MAARHIVMATVGSQGDLFPFLSVGRELAARGHRVTIGAHAIHREAVAEAGLRFVLASGIAEPEDKAAFAARAFHPLRGPRFVVRDLAAEDVAASYRALAPVCLEADAIVTSTLAFAGQILGETTRVAWLSAVLSPAVFLSAFDPPATGMARLDRFLRASPRRGAWVRRIGERVTAPWTRAVRSFRQSLGLAPVSVWGDPFHRGQHARDGVLAMYSPLLGHAPQDAPAHSVVTGYCRYSPFNETLPPELSAFLDAGDAPIVFTLGSAAVHAGEAFLRESMAAAGALGRRAVLLTGSPEMRARLPDTLPAGVMAVEYASHGALFPRASAVVHHGGVGTTQESLRAGCPALVVPHGFDQPDNAARVLRLGVGDVLPASRYRADRAAAKLRVLLTDEGVALRAQRAAEVIRAERGASLAADVIEQAMARRDRRMATT